MAAIIEKKGEEKFMGDVKKDDGTVVQEEQTREIFGARDGAIEKVDDHTVKLNLPAPDITIIPNFADYPALIVHRGFDEAGATSPRRRSAPGPWELVSHARSASRRVYKKRTNGAWWGDTVADMGPVYLDGVEYIDYGTDPSATIAAYEAGGDPHRLRDAAELRRDLRRARADAKSEAVTANTLCVRMNVKQPPFDNQQVRNAVQLGGRQRHGARPRLPGARHAWPRTTTSAPMHPEYVELLPPIARDPEKAKALMTEAGHADTELELISLDDDFNRNTCDAVAAQMRDAGMKVKRTVLPGNTFWNNWLGYPFSSTEWNMRPARGAGLCARLPDRRRRGTRPPSPTPSSTRC